MLAEVGAASTSCGRMTAAAPCGAVVAARNAFATASGALSGSLISPVNLVTVFISAAASIDWCVRLSRSSRPTAPHRATTGSCSVLAVSSPVARFAVPGPEVTSTTPGVPVRRPMAPAMNAAFCSCRHTTNCGPMSASTSKTASIFAPGTPKTYSTPYAVRASTTR